MACIRTISKRASCGRWIKFGRCCASAEREWRRSTVTESMVRVKITGAGSKELEEAVREALLEGAPDAAEVIIEGGKGRARWLQLRALDQPASCRSRIDNFMTSFATLRSVLQPQNRRLRRALRSVRRDCGAPASALDRPGGPETHVRLRRLRDAVLPERRNQVQTRAAAGPLPERFSMTDAQWDSLLIPIGLAFFLKSSTEGRVLAMYPGAAGSAESLLSLDTWTDIVQDNPGSGPDGIGCRGAAGEPAEWTRGILSGAHRQVL